MMAALYYKGVELENLSQRTQREQTDRQRTENSITDATLIPWITGLSGPISLEAVYPNSEEILEFPVKQGVTIGNISLEAIYPDEEILEVPVEQDIDIDEDSVAQDEFPLVF